MADDTFICSLCCGQSRSPDKCTVCSFYKDASSSKNYRNVPYYSTKEMSNSIELQDISYIIESILCAFDLEKENEFSDKTAVQLIELAFDKYHFKDSDLSFINFTLKDRFERMSKVIERDLSKIPEEKFIKVLASIYRSIQRRTNGSREYLQFAQHYVGARVDPGIYSE